MKIIQLISHTGRLLGLDRNNQVWEYHFKDGTWTRFKQSSGFIQKK